MPVIPRSRRSPHRLLISPEMAQRTVDNTKPIRAVSTFGLIVAVAGGCGNGTEPVSSELKVATEDGEEIDRFAITATQAHWRDPFSTGLLFLCVDGTEPVNVTDVVSLPLDSGLEVSAFGLPLVEDLETWTFLGEVDQEVNNPSSNALLLPSCPTIGDLTTGTYYALEVEYRRTSEDPAHSDALQVVYTSGGIEKYLTLSP